MGKNEKQNRSHGEFSDFQLQWLFFGRYLFSSRAGAVIRAVARVSSIATMIGVFSLILISSIMNGFNKTQSARLLNVEPHVLIKKDSSTSMSELDRSIAPSPRFQKYPFTQHDVILRSIDGRFSGAVAKGLPSEALYDFLERANRMRYRLEVDQKMFANRPELDPREVLLGEGLARDLNLFDGDELMVIPPETLLGPSGENLAFERMRVRRVFSTDFPEIDGRFIFYPISDQKLKFQSNRSGISGLELRLGDPNEMNKIIKKIKSDIGGAKGVEIETWIDRNQALFMALRLEKTAMLSLLGLSVLITCFSLITVITMLISQKRKDIQLLIAIGLSRERTEKLFLRLGLSLCMLGLLPGLFFGVLVSLLIEKFPVDILPDIYYDSSIPSLVSYPFVGIVAVACLFLAWITAKIPVTEAARKSVNSSFAAMDSN